MEIFPGGSGLSPSKEVNKGEIIIIWKGLGELQIQRINRGSELPEKRKNRQTHQDSFFPNLITFFHLW